MRYVIFIERERLLNKVKVILSSQRNAYRISGFRLSPKITYCLFFLFPRFSLQLRRFV